MISVSCTDEKARPSSLIETATVTASETGLKNNKKESESRPYVAQGPFELEDRHDGKFYLQPRIQFVWHPENEEVDSIWSIKLDGSDLKRVVDPNKLYFNANQRYLKYTPSRSPNRRYIAYTLQADFYTDRILLDLDAGTKIKLGSELSSAIYAWSPDNRYLFYRSGEFYRYDLITKEKYQLKDLKKASGLYAIDDGQTLLTVTRRGVEYFNYEGKFLKKFDLWGKYETSSLLFHFLSKDGKTFIFNGLNPRRIYTVEKKPIITKEYTLPLGASYYPLLLPGNNSIVFLYRGNLGKYNIKSEKIITIFKVKNGGINHMSLIGQ